MRAGRPELLRERDRPAHIREESAHLDLGAPLTLHEPAYAEVAVARVFRESLSPEHAERRRERTTKWDSAELAARRARELGPDRTPRAGGRILTHEVTAPALLDRLVHLIDHQFHDGPRPLSRFGPETPELGAYRFHEELKPRQPLVKLAKRLAMPVVVQPDTFEQRRVEVLERAEVITVSGRDLGDQRPRFARPRGEAPEPHVQRRERQHHQIG